MKRNAKKGVSLLLALLMLTGISQMALYSFAGKEILSYTEINDGNEFCVSACSKTASGEIIVPAQVGSKPVTEIADYCFLEHNDITSVKLPDSIRKIGDGAFERCGSLESINLPENVELGSGAFIYSEALSDIDFPEKFSRIGSNALTYTKWYNDQPNGFIYAANALLSYKANLPLGSIPDVESYTVKAGTEIICDDVFSAHRNLREINLPDSLIAIYNTAFSGCKALTNVVLPEGLISLGREAFSFCPLLESVVIPQSLKTISAGAFYRTGLKTVDIPSGVQTIENSAFCYCPSLVSVTLPNTLKTIAQHAFANSPLLENITIPYSVESIGKCAFLGCSLLSGLYIPSEVTEIGENAFGCKEDQDEGIVLIDGFELRCVKGSAAHTYAAENGLVIKLVEFKPGDINCDFTVTTDDARIALRAAVHLQTLTEKQKEFADIDHDGEITTDDARYILRISIGLTSYDALQHQFPADTH